MASEQEAADDALAQQMERDYYALLGVTRSASSDEIRAQFRQLSREFHPDRLRQRGHQGATEAVLLDAANEQYPLLDRAYKVLSDPRRRYVYDLYGESGVHALEQSDIQQQQQQQQQRKRNGDDDEDNDLYGDRVTLGEHLESSAEMQRAVEKLLRRLNQHALEAQFSSMSEMSMNVDASALVQEPMRALRALLSFGGGHDTRRARRRAFQAVARTEMTLHQRTTFPLSRATSLTLGGYMYDKQGLGLGCFTAEVAYASTDASIPSVTVATELGWTPKLHAQVTQPVSPTTVVLWVPELDAHGLDMSLGVNRRLAPHLHGAMMWSTRNGLSASLLTQQSGSTGGGRSGSGGGESGGESDSGSGSATSSSISVSVNPRHAGGLPSVALQTRRVLRGAAVSVKASLRATLASGISLVLGGSKQVSHRTRLALGVMLARVGVTLRLGFTRGPVRFVVPIFLSPLSAQSAFATFCAATTPFLATALATQLVQPARQRRARRQEAQRRETRRQHLASARHCAIAQQKLMLRAATDKRAQEEKRQAATGGGLVILVARYGRDPTNPNAVPGRHHRDDAGDASGEDATETAATTRLQPQEMDDDDSDCERRLWIDVTVPLQFFVQQSRVSLPASSKRGLLGFYDPCGCEGEGEQRSSTTTPSPSLSQLYVRYAYDGLVFEATFDDLQAVVLPARYAQPMGRVGAMF